MLACLLLSIGLQAQEKTIILHNNGNVLYETPVSNVEDIRFVANPASAVFNNQTGQHSFPIVNIDSITFGTYTPPVGDEVVITYNGTSVDVFNPFSGEGVTIETSQGNVTVYSIKENVPYTVTGSSSDGSLTINSNSAFTLTLHELSLTSATTSAINLASPVDVALELSGTNTIADGVNSSLKAALCAAGNLTVSSNGSMQSLVVTGNAKHGINVDGSLTVNGGVIAIADTDSDGIHVNGDLVWNHGDLMINAVGSDGLDVSGNVTLQGGELNIYTNAVGARGIKASGIFTFNNCELAIFNSGTDSKGIKCDSLMYVNYSGNLHIENSGDMSKGIKTDRDLIFTGGNITIISSGNTVVENVNGQNVPSYCTAIKGDANILISGGSFHITLPETNHGGKSISADGDLTVSNASFSIETHGNGAAYTVSGSTKDSYTSSCLKCEGNMELLSGTFTLLSTGTGGKGINVGGTLVIGEQGASNDDLVLDVTTTGERITVSSGGGGPWGGGEYANPKAVKSVGNLTINSGNITVNCTQNNEGGEGIESKAVLTINGGNIDVYSKGDDAVNASNKLVINGGLYYAHSDNNDGTDSNGTMELNGGFNISNGSRSPEEGFDCDWNQFKITGSTSIGTGGGTSDPTSSVCTQPALKINTQQGYAIQILKSDGTVICTYQCPEFTGGGGGWPGGGGGNNMTMLFTDPQLQTGQTYTVKYGGTISGGTGWHGYYTGNVTYSGGQSTTTTVNSMYTTVSAGGGGGW